MKNRKFGTHTQAMIRSSAPISWMITLGSRELPYFITSRSFGELSTQESITSNNRSQGGTFIYPIGSGTVNSINISIQYPNAWNESLSGMLENNVYYNKGLSYVKITKKDNKDIHLMIDYYYIFTQIGQGWIK